MSKRKRLLCIVPSTDALLGVNIYTDGTYIIHKFYSNKKTLAKRPRLDRDPRRQGTWKLDIENQSIKVLSNVSLDASSWSKEHGDPSFDTIVKALLDKEIETMLFQK